MTLKRVPDWPWQLHDAVEKLRGMPFEWGKHDCALFVADLVMVITGEDLASEFRGKYNTPKQALRALKKIGKGDLIDTVTSKLGARIDTNVAQRGDVVLVETEDEPALGMVLDHRAVAAGPDGINLFERSRWITAWTV